ncbi:MAG: UbiA family prenyltransferase, partial [Mycobacteriaceae bacterium]
AARTAALLRACHPEPTVAVTLVSVALALVAGRGWASILVGAAVLAGQLSIGWLNDAVDAARDRASRRPDKPVALGLLSPSTVRSAAVAAALLSVPLALASGVGGRIALWVVLGLHLVVVAGGWVYDLGVKSTIGSVLPYALAFGALPAFVVVPAAPVPWWLVAAGALLGSGAHFANVLPDLAADAATGVRGLPHVLGARWSVAATVGLLLAASIVLAFAPVGAPRAVGAAVVAAAVVALAIGLSTSLGLFRAVLIVALLDVLLLVASGASVR